MDGMNSRSVKHRSTFGVAPQQKLYPTAFGSLIYLPRNGRDLGHCDMLPCISMRISGGIPREAFRYRVLSISSGQTLVEGQLSLPCCTKQITWHHDFDHLEVNCPTVTDDLDADLNQHPAFRGGRRLRHQPNGGRWRTAVIGLASREAPQTTHDRRRGRRCWRR